MPRTSRHKLHKQSKHTSNDYSDSEEDMTETEKSSKDENSTKVHRNSASGEKRKMSSKVRECEDRKDLTGAANGEVLEEYASTKRRKEKTDVAGGGRWGGEGDDRRDSDRNMKKEMHKGDSMNLKEKNNKVENLRINLKDKSKWYESEISDEREVDSSASEVGDKMENKNKGESKRRYKRDSSARKEGKESKDKDRKSDKEKIGDQETKSGDTEVKKVDTIVGKKQAHMGDFSDERQVKRSWENSERTLQDELGGPKLEKEVEKRKHRKREGSGEQDKHYDDSKRRDKRRLSSRVDRAKDLKYRDDMHKDGHYADKYQEDGCKVERPRDEKYREEASDKDNIYQDDEYQEYSEKDTRHRGNKLREDDGRRGRRKDERHSEDGERDNRRKDNKHWEGIEREGQRDDKYHDNGDRDKRHNYGRYHKDVDKDIRHGDDRYQDGGDEDGECSDVSYRDDGTGDDRHKVENYQEHIEGDIRHRDSKQGGGHDREHRPQDSKRRDELTSRGRSGNKLDLKRSRDDNYGVNCPAKKSSAYDDSQIHGDKTARYQRANGKEDFGNIRSRGMEDHRSDAEKRSASNVKIDQTTDSRRGRRCSPPTSSAHTPRDNYGVLKPDGSMYRDYNDEGSFWYTMSSTVDYVGPVGVPEKTLPSQSFEKLGKKDDGHLREPSTERHLKSDIHSSPLQLVDKSPSSSIDKRQFDRADVRWRINVEESTQRTSGCQGWKEYYPVANGFLPFPPHVGFHSVMQPFPTPPLFGISQSMKFDHPAAYHMLEANSFSGPGLPVGWGHRIVDSGPPLHSQDASIAILGDESCMNGRSDWGHSRNLTGGQGGGTSVDLWKGPNGTGSMEMPSSEKENDSCRNEEALVDQSNQPAHNELTRGDQLVERNELTQLSKSFEKNGVEAPLISLEHLVSKSSINDNGRLFHFYLSKLDVSEDLTEPELFSKCTNLIDMDRSILRDVDDSKILYMEGEVAEMASHGHLNFVLFASNDDSVFKKSLSLYKRQTENLLAEDGEKLALLSEFIHKSCRADHDDIEEDKTEKLCSENDVQRSEGAFQYFGMRVDPNNSLLTADPTEISKEAVSTLDASVKSNLFFNPWQQDHDVEKPLSAASGEVSDTPLCQAGDATMKSSCNNDAVQLPDSKCGAILNSDESSEPMVPESVMSGSFNLSRIHHAPESTH